MCFSFEVGEVFLFLILMPLWFLFSIAEKIYKYSIEVGKHCPPKKSLWIVCHNTTTNKYLYEFYKVIYHLLPALLIDTYLRVIRRTPR